MNIIGLNTDIIGAVDRLFHPLEIQNFIKMLILHI